MAKNTFIGIDNKARHIKGGWIGVDGIARKIKAAWIGVDGVARQFWSSGITKMFVALRDGESPVAGLRPQLLTSLDGISWDDPITLYPETSTSVGMYDIEAGTERYLMTYVLTDAVFWSDAPNLSIFHRTNLGSGEISLNLNNANGTILASTNIYQITDASYNTTYCVRLSKSIDDGITWTHIKIFDNKTYPDLIPSSSSGDSFRRIIWGYYNNGFKYITEIYKGTGTSSKNVLAYSTNLSDWTIFGDNRTGSIFRFSKKNSLIAVGNEIFMAGEYYTESGARVATFRFDGQYIYLNSYSSEYTDLSPCYAYNPDLNEVLMCYGNKAVKSSLTVYTQPLVLTPFNIPERFTDVTYGNGKYVGYADNAPGGGYKPTNFYYSYDGITWTKVVPDEKTHTAFKIYYPRN